MAAAVLSCLVLLSSGNAEDHPPAMDHPQKRWWYQQTSSSAWDAAPCRGVCLAGVRAALKEAKAQFKTSDGESEAGMSAAITALSQVSTGRSCGPATVRLVAAVRFFAAIQAWVGGVLVI